MLKSSHRRTSQRIQGPFTSHSKKSASVQLNRISSQFKKKLRKGDAMELVE